MSGWLSLWYSFDIISSYYSCLLGNQLGNFILALQLTFWTSAFLFMYLLTLYIFTFHCPMYLNSSILTGFRVERTWFGSRLNTLTILRRSSVTLLSLHFLFLGI